MFIHFCEWFSIFGMFTVLAVLYYKLFPEDGKWVKLTVRPIVHEVYAAFLRLKPIIP